MKGPTDPKRRHLHAAQEAPEDAELRRALAALALDTPRPEELARVRQRLQTVFDQPVPQRSVLSSPRVLAVAGAALLGAALVLPRLWHGREPAPLPAAAPSAPAHASAPPSSAPDVSAATREPVTGNEEKAVAVAAEPAPIAARQHVRAEHRTNSSSQHTARVRDASSSKSAGTHEVTPQPTAAEAAPVSAPAADTASEAAAPAPAPAAQPERPQPEAAVAQPKPAPANPPDEVTLLQEARHSVSRDPQAALRFLDEHKRRYPHGTLSPEREVLAIELLRAQGRKQEAELRARAFQRDFPGSVYLQRVLR